MSRSKAKGSRIEREIVELHQALGVTDAERVPMSGALGGKYKDDVSFTLLREKLTAEVKARANGEGFAVIEKWLGSADILFLRKDKAKPLVLLPWHVWEWIIATLTSNAVVACPIALERPAPLPKAKKTPAPKARTPKAKKPARV